MDSTAGQILLPLAAGGISAYSPRYGGAGVAGALGAARTLNDRRISDFRMNQAKQEEQRGQEQAQAWKAYLNNRVSSGSMTPDEGLAAGFMGPEAGSKWVADRYKAKEPQQPHWESNLITNEYGDQVRDLYDTTTGTQKQVYVSGPKPKEEKESTDPYALGLAEFEKKNGRKPTFKESLAIKRQIKQAEQLPPQPEPPPKPGELSPSSLRQTEGIASRFGSEQTVKDIQTMAQNIDFVRSVGESPADDQGRVYAFAKMMDPNSVVREGEYKTVQQYSQALLEAWGFKARRVFDNSGFLTKEARHFMAQTMNKKYGAALKQYQNLESEYKKKLGNIPNLQNPENYLINYGRSFPDLEESQAQPAQGAPSGQIIQVSPSTGKRRVSNDGGKTWQPLPPAQ